MTSVLKLELDSLLDKISRTEKKSVLLEDLSLEPVKKKAIRDDISETTEQKLAKDPRNQ